MYNMNIGKEFEKFAISDGISSTELDRYKNGLTPYILEQREMRVTQMDIFSRMMMDRIIWLSGPVNQQMSDIVQAQLLFLDSVEKKDITLYINSPGGSVLSGLGIVDLMNYINSDVATVNVGMCASMGSVLLSSGTKGKRSSLIYSKVMTHQVSHSNQGVIEDTRISQLETEKYNYILFKILANNCGKPFEEMLNSSRRDKWFNSKEALDFGLIDEIIGLDKMDGIDKQLEGFDSYYEREVLNKMKS
jgi:ATP-dependent Clp protease protease subunit